MAGLGDWALGANMRDRSDVPKAVSDWQASSGPMTTLRKSLKTTSKQLT